MGGNQLGFADYEQTTAIKRTKREKFLSEMQKVMTLKALIDLIDPHSSRTSSKGGRPAYPQYGGQGISKPAIQFAGFGAKGALSQSG
jgi:hypothetical protein